MRYEGEEDQEVSQWVGTDRKGAAAALRAHRKVAAHRFVEDWDDEDALLEGSRPFWEEDASKTPLWKAVIG